MKHANLLHKQTMPCAHTHNGPVFCTSFDCTSKTLAVIFECSQGRDRVKLPVGGIQERILPPGVSILPGIPQPHFCTPSWAAAYAPCSKSRGGAGPASSSALTVECYVPLEEQAGNRPCTPLRTKHLILHCPAPY